MNYTGVSEYALFVFLPPNMREGNTAGLLF